MPNSSDGAPRYSFQRIGLWLGIILALLVGVFFRPDPDNLSMSAMAAVAVLMSVWWISEAIPLAATSLVPMALFPLLGIMPGSATASAYISSIIFIYLGGFLIALAMEKWNLHQRIALTIIGYFGVQPSAILMGFIAAAGGLSMWISNTATAVMMLPIGLAIIKKMEQQFGAQATGRFSVALMLGIAYACSIGGMATLVGTPTNLVVKTIYERTFPEAPSMSFAQWFIMAFPLALILLVITWLVLKVLLLRKAGKMEVDPDILAKERRGLGPIGYEEKVVLAIFATTALLWIFRSDIEVGNWTLTGWGGLWPGGKGIDDGTVAIAMATLLFLIPSRNPERSTMILDGNVFADIPWAIILLFGGGFALAGGLVETGLSRYLALQFTGLGDVPAWVTVLTVCFGMTFLTELTSNTASAQMILPLLASVATAQLIHPLLLMIPATLSASMAFMLPVATPPNAIVFASQRLRIAEMARTGVWLNFIGIAVVSLWVLWVMPVVFGFELDSFPAWAK